MSNRRDTPLGNGASYKMAVTKAYSLIHKLKKKYGFKTNPQLWNPTSKDNVPVNVVEPKAKVRWGAVYVESSKVCS